MPAWRCSSHVQTNQLWLVVRPNVFLSRAPAELRASPYTADCDSVGGLYPAGVLAELRHAHSQYYSMSMLVEHV